MIDAAGAAIVGGVIWIPEGVLLDDGPVDVGVVDVALIHAHDGCVVCEVVAAPFTAGESDATVTVSVVDAAVIAYVPSPVAVIESVLTVFPTPVRRSPKSALVGSGHPCAGNPVVAAIVVVAPVAGGPHEVWLRAYGLLIDDHGRRSEANTDADAELCACRECGDGNEQS